MAIASDARVPSASVVRSRPRASTPTTWSSGSRATRASIDLAHGAVTFEQLGVEVPASWSVNATQHPRPEVLPRAAGHADARAVAQAGRRPHRRHHHRRGVSATATSSTRPSSRAFRDELKYLMITQTSAFNSPVWFNIGVAEHARRARRCFILSVDDTMDSILNWYVEEGNIFKGGSGAGVNLSKIRASMEQLARRRHRQRPRQLHARCRRVGGHDQERRQDPPRRQDGRPRHRPSRHRRVRLVQGHRGAQDPRAARRRLRHGPRRQGQLLDPVPERQQLGAAHRRVHAGRASTTATGSCAPASTARVIKTVKARELFRQIGEAAWECADPGVQFDTTINRWHTAPNTGRITASNPCSEYFHLDNSSLQSRQPQPADVPARRRGRRGLRRRGVQADGRGHVHRARDPRSATPSTRPRRSAKSRASSARSGSATPTSARC